MEQGCVAIGDEKIADVYAPLPEGEFILHKGKKVHLKVVRG